MKTLTTIKTELKIIEFKSHTLGELYEIEVLYHNNMSKINGQIQAGRILSIRDSLGNKIKGDDYKNVEYDFYNKVDSLNKKTLSKQIF